MKKPNSKKFYGFVLTLWTTEQVEVLRKEAEYATYCICGKETCPTTGREHYQSFIHFPAQRHLSAIIRLFNKCKGNEVQVARGDANQNYDYCSKEDNVLFEIGSRPRPGRRTDQEEITALTRMRDVAASTSNFQMIRSMEKRLVYLEPERDFKPFVVWFYGGTGVGKSRGVHEISSDLYRPQSFKWWDGYDAHRDVLIDDFRADFCKFHDLLTLIDRYPYRVEFKGGMRQLRATRMFFTSPFHPASVYQGRTDEDVNQLTRRIDRIIHVRCVGDLEIHDIIK